MIEFEIRNNCDGEDCGDCCCQCKEENDLNEFKPYIEIGEKISEYMDLIEDNGKDSKAIRQAFVEFGSWILDNFIECVEDDESEDNKVINQTININIDNFSIENTEEEFEKITRRLRELTMKQMF